MGWFEEAMVESAEEREFFAKVLAGQNEWRAAEMMRCAKEQEELATNIVAQAHAPEGRYAFVFDEFGFAWPSEYATYVFDEDGDFNNRVRIKAATRRL